jgi:hypothetical protein
MRDGKDERRVKMRECSRNLNKRVKEENRGTSTHMPKGTIRTEARKKRRNNKTMDNDKRSPL